MVHVPVVVNVDEQLGPVARVAEFGTRAALALGGALFALVAVLVVALLTMGHAFEAGPVAQ